ncbi:hypothetical protein GPJ56_001357 [Histomonas meleagridis]|uniref:uncharacterized protein n=1 Tax=Histomonas meleagridis TaxID=135588 RepID=UPI00355ABF06|nr:hypothetical protein GPJ56_001357 [Histomonas meleagridis]KAH0805113.1 hypothetical protein GO595_002058 [Histomonas meleagridis]
MSYRTSYFQPSLFNQPLLLPTAKRGGSYHPMRYEQPQMVYFQPNYQTQYRMIPQGQYPSYIQPGFRMPVWVPGKFQEQNQNPNLSIQHQMPLKPQIDNISYRQSMQKALVPEQKTKAKKLEDNPQKLDNSKYSNNNEVGIPVQSTLFTQDKESPPGFFNIIGRGSLPSISFNFLTCDRK